VPPWTQEKARINSVASYRSNPMAKAIIDTYTAFCVGDSGVSLQVTNPQVAQSSTSSGRPAQQPGRLQELWLRDQLLMGESLHGDDGRAGPGATRFCPIDPSIIERGGAHQRQSAVAGSVHFPAADATRG
jgi:hypothetical protein